MYEINDVLTSKQVSIDGSSKSGSQAGHGGSGFEIAHTVRA